MNLLLGYCCRCDEPAVTSEDSIRAPTTVKSFKVIKSENRFFGRLTLSRI